MPVLRVVRSSSTSTHLGRTVPALLLTILCCAITAAAQTQTATTTENAPAAQGQTVSSAPQQSSSGSTAATTIAPPDTAREASDSAASAPAATGISEKDAASLPAKYNVALIGQRKVGGGLDFYSLDREIALGRQLSMEVESSSKLVTDPIINEYINRIGQDLVAHSDARVPFTIKVLDNNEVNAFALPGGFFYVDSGLILAADNEAELAGVMSHEIAHVAARHATKNMTRAQIWNIASVPLIFIGGPVAYAVSEAAGLAVPLGFLKFSRDAEREADLLGLEYDYASGYDPQAFVEFFEKLNIEKKKPNLIAKAFATHPMNVERITAAQEEIRKYLPDRAEYVVNTSEFDSIKARLQMLENSRRLGGPKDTGGKPVLRRAQTSDSPPATGAPDKKDDGHPTLKRSPSAASDLRAATQAAGD